MNLACKSEEDCTFCSTVYQLFTISENHITDNEGTHDIQSTNIKHNLISLHSYLYMQICNRKIGLAANIIK